MVIQSISTCNASFCNRPYSQKHQLGPLIALWWCICWIPGSGPMRWDWVLVLYQRAYLDLARVSGFKSPCLKGTQYGGSSAVGLTRRPCWATLNIWECWESKHKRGKKLDLGQRTGWKCRQAITLIHGGGAKQTFTLMTIGKCGVVSKTQKQTVANSHK